MARLTVPVGPHMVPIFLGICEAIQHVRLVPYGTGSDYLMISVVRHQLSEYWYSYVSLENLSIILAPYYRTTIQSRWLVRVVAIQFANLIFRESRRNSETRRIIYCCSKSNLLDFFCISGVFVEILSDCFQRVSASQCESTRSLTKFVCLFSPSRND